MYTGLIAKRYAAALDRFAVANGEELAAYEQSKRFTAAYLRAGRLRETLFSPVLSGGEKFGVACTLFGEAPCRSLGEFIRLVIRHRRERYLNFMLHSFQRLYRQRHGLHEAQLITAGPLPAETVERIRRLAAGSVCGEVEVHHTCDPELIGGFVLRLGDWLADASLRSQLNRLKLALGGKSNRIV